MPGNTIKKVCLYKNCGAKNCTLFRFPKEPERFAVWVENSGLDIKGNIDLNKARFLCDKHFSNNYISFQSRRKMLVHTAIPMHHNGTHELIPSSKSKTFKLVDMGESTQLTSKHEKSEIEEAIKSINGNNLKSITLKIPAMRPKSNRQSMYVKGETNCSLIVDEPLQEQEPMIVSEVKDDVESMVENATKLHFENNEENIAIETEDLNEFLPRIKRSREECSPTNASPSKKKKVKIIYVHKKRPEVIKEAVINFDKKDDKTMVCSEEDITLINNDKPKILNNSDVVEIKPMFQHGISMSNRSEFIFNGEMYVQMSKRNYEAEKLKLQNEVDHYKALLKQLKDQVLAINID
ncbi:unnamed protein product [Diamesa serratosioi]